MSPCERTVTACAVFLMCGCVVAPGAPIYDVTTGIVTYDLSNDDVEFVLSGPSMSIAGSNFVPIHSSVILGPDLPYPIYLPITSINHAEAVPSGPCHRLCSMRPEPCNHGSGDNSLG